MTLNSPICAIKGFITNNNNVTFNFYIVYKMNEEQSLAFLWSGILVIIIIDKSTYGCIPNCWINVERAVIDPPRLGRQLVAAALTRFTVIARPPRPCLLGDRTTDWLVAQIFLTWWSVIEVPPPKWITNSGFYLFYFLLVSSNHESIISM